MKALILNSGMGSRMGVLTSEHPKCMTEISPRETILSRQLSQLAESGISEAVITTGLFDEVLVRYVESLDLPIRCTFVKNERYRETNYIFSIHQAREALRGEDILLMHGDLVFENEVLDAVLACETSCMAVSSTQPLPEKDFKAVIREGRIRQIGIHCFESALAAQPLYQLKAADWDLWLAAIGRFCEAGNDKVYAEEALNELLAQERGGSLASGWEALAAAKAAEPAPVPANRDEAAIRGLPAEPEPVPAGGEEVALYPLDVKNALCAEIDNPEDLERVSAQLRAVENRTVYCCFSTDILHGGHIALIRRARRLGKLTVGVLSDEAVASYKRFPLVPAVERRRLFEAIEGVSKVIEQRSLSYKEVLSQLKPDIVVHGDDWVSGFQQPVRDEVLAILKSYGGRLVEFPYSRDAQYTEIDKRQRADLAMPDLRRARLRRLLEIKGLVRVMEAHDGLTGLVVENTVVHENGGARQYDAMWLSSLCDSTARGKPDIELVDMTSRFRTLDDIMEVTTKPVIFDGDTGGLTEHFVYTVRSLERMGVSMVIIEDKTGLKKNSLFGTEVVQTQDSIEHFSEKIRAGKKAQRTKEFMICARIESLILEKGMADALARARAFVAAGADAIMIHSRKKDPAEIFAFLEAFRKEDPATPVVLVPTSFNSVKEEEWKARGANIVIYANQLMRAAVPAIQKAAETILQNHRAEECDAQLMPFKEIIRLIPEEL